MEKRTATCSCGLLSLRATGDPLAVSVCHCLECQKRTGSVFGAQARYLSTQLEHQGRAKLYKRTGDTGASVSFFFCPQCGTTLYWKPEKLPEQTSVALGAFTDPEFTQSLSYTVYNARRHSFVGKLDAQEHYD